MPERDYYPVIEAFLKEIDGKNVNSITLVALLDEPDARDITASYNCSPADLGAMAGIIQLRALHQWEHVDRDEEE